MVQNSHTHRREDMAAEQGYTEVSLNPDAADRKPLRFVKAKELVPGEIIEGIYRGTLQSTKYPAKNDYKFETDTEILVVNTSGMLAKKMASVQENDIVRLTYGGSAEIKSGPMAGNLAHVFDVAVKNS